MIELFKSSLVDPCIVRDKIPFGTGGEFGLDVAVLYCTVPDVRCGDVLWAHGQAMLNNRTLVGGQMIPSLFVSRRLMIEEMCSNLWGTTCSPVDSVVMSPAIGHNMGGKDPQTGLDYQPPLGVYADTFLVGSWQADRDYGDRLVVARYRVSSERATTANFMPVLDRAPGRNQSSLSVMRIREDDQWRVDALDAAVAGLEARIAALESGPEDD